MKKYLIYQCCLAFGILLTLTGTKATSQPAAKYGRVELLRDSWGVPNVFAETDEGAMYGAGYACAEDRGFQMYYFLRIPCNHLPSHFTLLLLLYRYCN